MVSRDIRYTIIKPLLDQGRIQTFSDIFIHIPFSVVGDDLGKRSTRFRELIQGVEKFQLKELLIIARMFNLSNAEMFKLVENELSSRQSKI